MNNSTISESKVSVENTKKQESVKFELSSVKKCVMELSAIHYNLDTEDKEGIVISRSDTSLLVENAINTVLSLPDNWITSIEDIKECNAINCNSTDIIELKEAIEYLHFISILFYPEIRETCKHLLSDFMLFNSLLTSMLKENTLN